MKKPLPYLKVRAERALHNFYQFCVDYIHLDLKPQPHAEMCALIQECEIDDETPYAMLIVPRGCYKTSITRAGVIWKQLRHIWLYDNPYHRIVLVSATLNLANQSLQAIEAQLKTNKQLNEDFGELWMEPNRKLKRGGSRDKTGGIILGPRLLAGEIGGVAGPSIWVDSDKKRSTGAHADEADIDDINDDSNTKTPEQREKALNQWRVLQPILTPKDRTGRPSRITFKCTRWHDADVAGEIMRLDEEKKAIDKRYKSPWKMVVRGAWTEPGETEGPLYFPDAISEEHLAKTRDDMGTWLFSCNYLNDPIGQRGFIDEDNIIWKEPEEIQKPLRYMRICIDPNFSSTTRYRCWCAIVVAGYDQLARICIVDALGSRDWGPVEFIDTLFKLAAEYPGVPILIEDVHSVYLEHSINNERATRSAAAGDMVKLPITWVAVDRNVEYRERWARIEDPFRRGRVWFSKAIPLPIRREIVNELVRGESARFNDFLDAICMVQEGVRPRIITSGGTAKPQVVQHPPTQKSKLTWADVMPDEWKRVLK